MKNRLTVVMFITVGGLFAGVPPVFAQVATDPVKKAQELRKKLEGLQQQIEKLRTEEKDLQAKVKEAEKKAEEFQQQFVKVEIRGTITSANPSLLSVGGVGQATWFVVSRGMKWRLAIPAKDEKLLAQLKSFKDKAALIVGRLTQQKSTGADTPTTPLVSVTSISSPELPPEPNGKSDTKPEPNSEGKGNSNP
ncbi:MAG: hypothetical protein ACFCD0_02820 [Gemmataceae bacterium]